MRPNHRWTVLHVFILAGMLLPLKAGDEASECEVAVRVHQNTVYAAVLGEDLRINCTVEFCSGSPPRVFWYKQETTAVPVNVSSSSHIKTEWKLLNRSVGTSFLIFQNVRRNDSGRYQCGSEESISHNINVSVHGVGERTNVTKNNDASGTTPEPTRDLWLYLYFAAGIGAFVIIVIIISVASMRGCIGKSKKQTQTENQYMVIPLVERGQRESPSAPPSRSSTRRKTSPSQPDEPPSLRDNVYDQTREEVGSSVVYAALNHQPPSAAAAAARPRRPREEPSEYAAIRV
ncbi:B- and T-lymphocyte attenuator-like [Clinocottus analis]|uniref:B- and T-lymphocyte attenuator-like n=1 Tax=Clinocottus analis TaxID=304258 RepID=UPI0035C1037F